jgi:hypothetical protein
MVDLKIFSVANPALSAPNAAICRACPQQREISREDFSGAAPGDLFLSRCIRKGSTEQSAGSANRV